VRVRIVNGAIVTLFFASLVFALWGGAVLKDIVMEANRKCTFDAIDRSR